MEHISAPIARVVAHVLLCQDVRLKTLFPPDHRVRQPRRDTFHNSRDSAARDRNIDHGALLDMLWKIRSLQTLCGQQAQMVTDARTRELLLVAATSQEDLVAEIELLLARKAEAELWLERIE